MGWDPSSWSATDALNVVLPGSTLIPGLAGNNAVQATGGALGVLNNFATSPDAALEAQRKRLLQQQAQSAGNFADVATGNYQNLGNQGYGALAGLQATANGQNSVSAEQLRQGLMQRQAQMQSMAAGAAPRNAAMAARTAMIQSNAAGAGLAGQQAVAGLQERQQAQQAYGGLLQGLRGQDLQGSLGGRNAAIQGYGAANAGQPAPSDLQKYGPMIMGGLQMAAGMPPTAAAGAAAPTSNTPYGWGP